MKKVAFICTHNSCRSQIAEALGHHLAGEIFESYSAGTDPKAKMNQDAVRIVKQMYGIDMEKNQYPKTLEKIPHIDIAVTMGCNVQCPYLPCTHREDWGLDDPTGQADEVYIETIKTIASKIQDLAKRIDQGSIGSTI